MIRHKYLIAVFASYSLVAVIAHNGAMAANNSVTTEADEETSYLVSDPDVGDFTVTISGYSIRDLREDRYYFRTESSSSAIDETWSIAITGLDPGEVITDLSLSTTRIVPTVGSGGTWDWDIELSAPLGGGGTYTDSRQLIGDVTIDPDITFDNDISGDHFGENPTFSINVSKSNSNTRSLGWYNLSITAALGSSQPIPGDTTGNGIVDIDDLTPILQNYRTVQADRTSGDLVDNDFIDFADFRQWKTAFLQEGGSLEGINLDFLSNSAVPEPASLAMLGVAVLGVAVVMKRHRS
ncbi:PEP-CTERM sorting domain-containing protein [Aeoliella straminimaris]|nr:PEP-CTERM sorting domain-containing protein [Aeoliella straminimaris]